ncbi:TetR/AcrR family transcriptional regulator [Nocardia callitridis]|uniref:TetR/AcrR family transcriptional regulator n=1 Tax=Nocardia callitridis TaxID=648753 RepID=A0ABP9KQ76_9NOCA
MTKPLRRDAARNREKLLRHAADVFTEDGLDGSLEEIARRAGVSIGTLYNHFPHRDALIGALLPQRIAAMDELAARAAAEPDPWRGFATFIAELLVQFSVDRALMEVIAGGHPAATQLADACHRGMTNLAGVLTRARAAGAVRPDATDQDVIALIAALAQLPDPPDSPTGRRCLTFVLDGLRTPQPQR